MTDRCARSLYRQSTRPHLIDKQTAVMILVDCWLWYEVDLLRRYYLTEAPNDPVISVHLFTAIETAAAVRKARNLRARSCLQTGYSV
jgi:hypothetical protein